MSTEEQYKSLEKVAKSHFKNLSNLALQLGKQQQFFYSYKSKKIGYGLLSEMKDKLNINPEYIRSGAEPMLLKEEQNIRNVQAITEKDFEYLSKIRVYTLTAQAAESESLVSFDDLPISVSPLAVGMKLNSENIEAVRVSGFSLYDIGIEDGDLVLYDIRATPKNGNIVVCLLNGVALIKKFRRDKKGVIILESAYNGLKPIIVNHIDDRFQIIGVVKHSIKHWY